VARHVHHHGGEQGASALTSSNLIIPYGQGKNDGARQRCGPWQRHSCGRLGAGVALIRALLYYGQGMDSWV
jgi:hypothetical protein